MKIFAIVNMMSGSVPQQGDTALMEALSGHEAEVKLVKFEPGERTEWQGACADWQPDIVIVWGGDGTVSSVLTALGPEGPPVLPLPGGTMNLLHKAIHGDAYDWQTCLKRGLDGKTQYLPGVEVDTRRFYVAAFIGKLTKLADLREAVREGDPITGMKQFANHDALAFDEELSVHGESASGKILQASAFAILPSADNGKLEIAGIDPNSPLDLIWTSLKAVAGDWRDAASVRQIYSGPVCVKTKHLEILEVTLDGETDTIPSGAQFKRIDKAVRVLSAS